MRRLAAALIVVGALVAASPAHAGDPLRSRQWGLSMIGSDAAHSTTRGAGAVVAVLDTGVRSSHGDLRGRLVAGRDVVGGDSTPQDADGHGTHVTGIVAANEGNGIGVASVAPGARVMPIKVLGDDGTGSAHDVAVGIDYATTHGAQVINMSLGPDVPLMGPDAEIGAAMGRATRRGVVIVVASGNNGLPICEQPEARGRALCVGAVDRRGSRSFFSSFGEGLGIVAPGGSALSLADEDIWSTWNDGGYEELAGTSQAAPHVSGVAALLASVGVRGQAAVRRILATARDAGPSGPDPQYGAGIVNARAAVAGLGRPGGRGRSRRRSSSFRISFRRRQRISYVLRHGIRVRCRAAGRGRCRVVATRRHRRLARGSRRLKAGRSVLVRARVNRRGRRVLRRALRRHKRLRLRLRIRLPGISPQIRRITLVPR